MGSESFGNVNKFLAASLVLFSCCLRGASTNSIDELVQRLDASNGLWMNGISPVIELSSNATPREVLETAAEKTSWGPGRINTFRIIEVRPIKLKHWQGVRIQDRETGKFWEANSCTAISLESNLGPKILLIRFTGRWWTRFFDVPGKGKERGPPESKTPPSSKTNGTSSATFPSLAPI